MHIYTPSNSIFNGLVTNLLSIVYIWIEILYCAHAKRQKKKKKTSHNDFTFDTLICLFLSDDAASVAVKGLITFSSVQPPVVSLFSFCELPVFLTVTAAISHRCPPILSSFLTGRSLSHPRHFRPIRHSRLPQPLFPHRWRSFLFTPVHC